MPLSFLSRRAGPVLLAFSVACGGPGAPTEQYGFLALLGQDTVAIESITRYQDRFVSEAVDRFPEVKRRHTEVRLAEDGSPRRMDMRVSIPNAPAGESRERRIVAEFEVDTVRVALTDRSGTRHVAMASDGMLTVPHVPQMYSLLELYFAAALKRAEALGVPEGGTITVRQFYPDREFSNYPVPMHRGYVKPGPGNSVQIQHNWLAGTGQAEVDSAGRLLEYSGARTTYLVAVTRLATPPDIETIGAAMIAAERSRGPAAALSRRDTTRATIGATAFLVDYGRPGVRGRTLLGNVIPWDAVWRTGANAATQLSVSAPVRLGGISLAPGTYTLWTLPRRDGVTLIVNRQTGQWGTGYGPAHDLGRTPMRVDSTTAPVEDFTISIESETPRLGRLVMEWGPFRWSAPIETGG